MKISELFESSEWENTEFTTRLGEIAFLERKKKAIDHQQTILYQKLVPFVEKGIITFDTTHSVAYGVVPGTPDRRTDYKRYYAPKGHIEIQRIGKEIYRLDIKDSEITDRIRELTIKGHTFCFTGFRSKEMEQQIEALGGRISSGVSNSTTFVVTDDPMSSSGKVLKAKQHGIRIITREKLIDILKR